MKKRLSAELAQQIQSEALFHAGCAAYYAGDTKKAKEAFEASLVVYPSNHNSIAALEQLNTPSQ